jgi:hypothetical protein
MVHTRNQLGHWGRKYVRTVLGQEPKITRHGREDKSRVDVGMIAIPDMGFHNGQEENSV